MLPLPGRVIIMRTSIQDLLTATANEDTGLQDSPAILKHSLIYLFPLFDYLEGLDEWAKT